MKAIDIRQKFFDYFMSKNHEKVASSSLIPAQDPTLLFANAGMNQFKDVFLGIEKRSYSRAVTIQKCVRAGGKHNDLDNVGFTKRHLTFFEMMGNFSFGDYFKKEAIAYAWEFLTQDMHLDPHHMHATVHHTDDEAYNLWHTMIGLPQEKIHRLGDESNFWQMGDVGPCGPCSEIFVDRGPRFGCGDASCSPDCGCDRFLEVWNLVFMQYDRQADGSRKELKHKGVDTGMGLERLCAIVQQKDSVFEIDLFAHIIEKTEELCGKKYDQCPPDLKAAFHVIADHIRASTMLIADGCAPSNDGRGYVLRKIIRRAALFAQKLTDKNIFPLLSGVVVDQMHNTYPELTTNRNLIHAVLESEIERFATNLVRGTVVLEEYFKQNKESKHITGTQAFKLYDTYGFPIELITATARERGYTIDMPAYDVLMEQQRAQSGKKDVDVLAHLDLDETIASEFTGYQELETTSDIIALVHNNHLVSSVPAGATCFVIARQSPFFIVGGGQVPDQGWLTLGGIRVPLMHVRFIQKAIAVEVVTPVDLHIGDTVISTVNAERRINAMKNHTATHILQSALITLFGNQIKQSGSLVDPDYLRFDFTYHTNLSTDDITNVEDLVNAKIRENIPVTIEYTTLRTATQKGAIAFFGDKYNPDNVRVVHVADFSSELCGGTHVARTGDIGTFKIIEVSALSAGHRRIVALTGPKAIEHYQHMFAIVKALSQELSVKPEAVATTVIKQKEELLTLQKQYTLLQRSVLHTRIPEWQQQIHLVKGIPTLYLMLENINSEQMRDIVAQIAAKTEGFYFIGSTLQNRASFYTFVSPAYRGKIDTKALAIWLKENYGLQGGGKSGELQGGGNTFKNNFKHDLFAWIEKQ